MTSKERVLAIYPDVKVTSLHSITGNVAYYVLLPGEPTGFFLVTRPTEDAAWDAACDRIRAKMGLTGRSPDVDALVKAAELAVLAGVCDGHAYHSLQVALAPFRLANEEVILRPTVGGKGVEIVGGKPKAEPPVIELRRRGGTWTASAGLYSIASSDPDIAVYHLRESRPGLASAKVVYVARDSENRGEGR